MILREMLISLRHHGCVLMPHQHGEADRVNVVLEAFGRIRMSNPVRTHLLLTELLLQTLEAAVDRVFRPGTTASVSKDRPVRVLTNKPPADFGSSLIQNDDSLSFAGLVVARRQDGDLLRDVDVRGFEDTCLDWPTAGLPKKFQEVSEFPICNRIQKRLKLSRRIDDFTSPSWRLVLQSGQRQPYEQTLIDGPVERPLHMTDRVVPRRIAPRCVIAHPRGDVARLQLRNDEALWQCSRKRTEIPACRVIRRRRAILLNPSQIEIKQTVNRRRVGVQLFRGRYQLPVSSPRLLLVAAQIDLLAANLDVPALREFPKKWLRLSHR